MGKFLAVFLILVAAGVPMYFIASPTGVHFDVTSARNPLGHVDIVHKWLDGHGYQRVSGGVPWVRTPPGTHHFRYQETWDGKTGTELCHVDIWVDGAGQIRTLAATFASGSRTIDPTYSVTQGLAASLWARVTGSPPGLMRDHLTDTDHALGLRCDWDGDLLEASWVKLYTDKDAASSIVDRVLFEMK